MKTIELSSKIADLCCVEYYKDKTKSWPNYGSGEITVACKHFGYVPEDMFYRRFDTNKEILIFSYPPAMIHSNWQRSIFRLRIANWFFKKMKWCYEMFRPE